MNKKDIVKLVKEKLNAEYEIKLTDVHSDSEVLIIPCIKDVIEKGDISKVKQLTVRDIYNIYKKQSSNIYQYMDVNDRSDLMMITLTIAKKETGKETQIIQSFNKVEINLVGNNIALYRKKAGFSQKEFAEKLNIKQQTLSAFENENFQARRDDIDKMLKIFKNITYDELFNTGKESLYISNNNSKLLDEYINKLNDVFSSNSSEYENKRLIVNLILRIFLEGDQETVLRHGIQNILDGGEV